MTYARARLYLGITGVGTMVTASAALLIFDVPRLALAPWINTLNAGWPGDLLGLSLVWAAYVAISGPFDLLGGWLLPRQFGRAVPPWGTFVGGWLRGVLFQGAIMLAAGVVMLAAARSAPSGLPATVAAIAAAAAVMVALWLGQGPLARRVGGLAVGDLPDDLSQTLRATIQRWAATTPQSPMPPLPTVRVWAGADPGLSGGIVGVGGLTAGPQIVLPAAWLTQLPPEALAAEILRRAGQIHSGARIAGVVVGLLWNLTGLAVAAAVTAADLATVAGLIQLAAAFTIWGFLGLLILPSLSRPGVLAGDHYARACGVPVEVLRQMMTDIDRRGDDEPSRPPLVETIFHPIPNVSARMARLTEAPPDSPPPWGAWQAARMALFLSWAGLGFLGRAVHCNSGRPELWVVLPCD